MVHSVRIDVLKVLHHFLMFWALQCSDWSFVRPRIVSLHHTRMKYQIEGSKTKFDAIKHHKTYLQSFFVFQCSFSYKSAKEGIVFGWFLTDEAMMQFTQAAVHLAKVPWNGNGQDVQKTSIHLQGFFEITSIEIQCDITCFRKKTNI